MDFEELSAIKDEAERVNRTYDIFDEEKRLRSKAGRVEFITTVRYIEKYLKPGDKILDIGAGTGAYSIYFSRNGYEVSSLELADANIRKFREKIMPSDCIDLVQGNALDLSRYPDGRFDIVLVLGPLYHLEKPEDKQRCIAEAKRVCKDGGKIFFAFISNDMVPMTEFAYDEKYFLGDTYDHETFKVFDFPFVFHTLDEMREILHRGGVKILNEVASDGMSELLAGRINALDEQSYEQYLRYHFYVCERPEMLGRSNHLLFATEKE